MKNAIVIIWLFFCRPILFDYPAPFFLGQKRIEIVGVQKL